MKLDYVKFFQGVQIETPNGFETSTWAKSDKFVMELEGQLIRITPKAGGPSTYVTVYNVCFMRATNDDNKTKGARGTSKATAES